MRYHNLIVTIFLLSFAATNVVDAGLIKNIWNKVTNSTSNKDNGGNNNGGGSSSNSNNNGGTSSGGTNNIGSIISNGKSRADELDLSIPFCGNSLFSSKEDHISPEIIFITKSPAKTKFVTGNNKNSSSNENSLNSGRYNNSTQSHQGNHYDGNQSQNQSGRNNQHQGQNGQGGYSSNGRSTRESERDGKSLNPVTYEFRFHAENVTLQELEENGFNRDAPISFLIHGFTSGYPLQSWMTGMVESYTIKESKQTSGSTNHYGSSSSSQNNNYGSSNSNSNSNSNYGSSSSNQNSNSNSNYGTNQQNNNYGSSSNSNYGNSQNNGNNYGSSSSNSQQYGQNSQNSQSGNHHRRDRRSGGNQQQASNLVSHNLFIVNWNYAARGPVLYPRAVANIVPVSKYISEFINKKLLEEARVPSHHIQLVGHSLGAHLSGFVAKATTQKVGRIFGLDPAGPCFGNLAGSLFPQDGRLSPDDAEEVVTIHTNYELLGIEAPVGKYSVYVEGGKRQPGCGSFAGFAWKSLSWDGPDFDKVACSHSRAPGLLTTQLSTSKQDNCQMVAYECSDWESFKNGFCGICDRTTDAAKKPVDNDSVDTNQGNHHPTKPIECIRIGLEWQYRDSKTGHNQLGFGLRRKDSIYSGNERGYSSPGDDYSTNSSSMENSSSTAQQYNQRRARGLSLPISIPGITSRASSSKSEKPKKMFMRTSNTQPYCTYHYQVILELSEPLETKKPPMSIVLQDAKDPHGSSSHGNNEGHRERRDESSSSLSSDEFGTRFDDKTFTQLITSNKKLNRVEHASLIFRSGIPEGDKKKLKSITVNYMSHVDPEVRAKLSSKLCVVTSSTDQSDSNSQLANRRIYFAPCELSSLNQSQRPPSHQGNRPTQTNGSSNNHYGGNQNNNNNENHGSFGNSSGSGNNHNSNNQSSNQYGHNSNNHGSSSSSSTNNNSNTHGGGQSGYNNNNHGSNSNSNGYDSTSSNANNSGRPFGSNSNSFGSSSNHNSGNNQGSGFGSNNNNHNIFGGSSNQGLFGSNQNSNNANNQRNNNNKRDRD